MTHLQESPRGEPNHGRKNAPPIHHQSLDLLAIDFKNSAIIITHLPICMLNFFLHLKIYKENGQIVMVVGR